MKYTDTLIVRKKMIMDALSASFHSKPNHVGLNNAKVISKNEIQIFKILI